MKPSTAEYLFELNRRFYQERGRDFSETRPHIQPGIKHVLDTLQGNEPILDLGCGNGTMARELSRRSHVGPYLGFDFSAPLLEEARRRSYSFPVTFIQTDLLPVAHRRLSANNGIPALEPNSHAWSLITAFAVLHHIPGHENRLTLLTQIRAWLGTNGVFAHSCWQFSSSPRMRSRIQSWSSVGRDATEMDEGDYLLDWRHGERGLRYVHEFREAELVVLAEHCGFQVISTYYSDGADHRSGLYQMWRPTQPG